MFSLQTSDELGFGTPTKTEVGLTDHAFFMTNNLISFSIGCNDGDQSKKPDYGPRRRGQNEWNKAKHREVERKRRQEMSNLCAYLGSLLPNDQIEGKLSVCDQLQEATSHIKNTQKKIEELKIHRDKLKSLLNPLEGDVESSDYVTVNINTDTTEFLISGSMKAFDGGLSRVLVELQKRELDVVSIFSTRMNGRFVHQILVEARDMTKFGVLMLQQRLIEAMMIK